MLRDTMCSTCWESLVECTCQSCARRVEIHGTIADAVKELQRRGWRTVAGSRLSDPMSWVCSECAKEEK